MKFLSFFATLAVAIVALVSSVHAQTEEYTPRWQNERVYPQNFNTWWFWIGYNSSDSTGCAAPYEIYGNVEHQPCRIQSWDAVPNAEGVYYSRIRTSTGCIIRWPWKWYSYNTGATYYFLSRTP